MDLSAVEAFVRVAGSRWLKAASPAFESKGSDNRFHDAHVYRFSFAGSRLDPIARRYARRRCSVVAIEQRALFEAFGNPLDEGTDLRRQVSMVGIDHGYGQRCGAGIRKNLDEIPLCET